MNKLYKIIIPSLLTISLLSCSQSIENAQVFIATNDLQIGSNRFTFAVADKNGLVNRESIEVALNGDGGYPKIIKSFNFVEFPDYYNTELKKWSLYPNYWIWKSWNLEIKNWRYRSRI